MLLLSDKIIAELQQKAEMSDTQRARINLHSHSEDLIQQMIICFTNKSRIRPHRRNVGVKTYYLVKGVLDVFVFDEKGICVRLIRLSDSPAVGHNRVLTIEQSFYLMPVAATEFVTIFEVASGPFRKGNDEYLLAEINSEKFEMWLSALYEEMND